MSEENKPDNTNSGGDSVIKTEKKKKMPKWKLVLIVLVLGIGALVFAAARSAQGAIKAADVFVSDLQAGRCSQMYARSTSNFRDLGSEEVWNDACTRVGGILQGTPDQQGVAVESASGSDQASTVTYKIQGNDGLEYMLAIGLVNQDGEWKIDVFDSDPVETEN